MRKMTQKEESELRSMREKADEKKVQNHINEMANEMMRNASIPFRNMKTEHAEYRKIVLRKTAEREGMGKIRNCCSEEEIELLLSIGFKSYAVLGKLLNFARQRQTIYIKNGVMFAENMDGSRVVSFPVPSGTDCETFGEYYHSQEIGVPENTKIEEVVSVTVTGFIGSVTFIQTLPDMKIPSKEKWVEITKE